MKYVKITYWFLALSMFTFGVLKFIHPFKGWYEVQIANSGLGNLSYVLGIAGEISVGATLMLCLLYRTAMHSKTFHLITSIAFFAIAVMMLTGIYVHMHPDVPAAVLPLKIKPPYIPFFFLALAVLNMIHSARQRMKNAGNKA